MARRETQDHPTFQPRPAAPAALPVPRPEPDARLRGRLSPQSEAELERLFEERLTHCAQDHAVRHVLADLESAAGDGYAATQLSSGPALAATALARHGIRKRLAPGSLLMRSTAIAEFNQLVPQPGDPEQPAPRPMPRPTPWGNGDRY
jgi:hypothetical protein